MKWLAGVMLATAWSAFAVEDGQDCWLATPGGAQGIAATCMKIAVPLGSDDGAEIELNVGVLPASSNKKSDDAIFFLAGGPGQAATESYPQLAGVFARLNATRDIVLVDQRGTGGSARLDCAIEMDELQLQSIEDIDYGAMTRECLAGLQHDPRYFLTKHAAQDIEAVRVALGYSKVNLVGVSYGTRLAQRFAQMYPDSVRSIVLDSAVPNDLALGFEHAISLDRALDRLFDRCENDEACQQAFGDVRETFATLRAEVAEQPEVTVRDPRTGESQTMMLDSNTMAFVVRLLSYTSETQALLPLLMHQAVHESDYAPLVAQALMMASSLGEQISRGLELAVMCAEDVPDFPDRHAGDDTLLGRSLIDGATQQCHHWPNVAVDPARREPLAGRVPVLVLSGSEDPVTPPSYGDRVVRHLNNAIHVEVPGHGHNVLPRGCVPKITSQFIETASVESLDVECVEAMGPMPFFISTTGPTP